MELKEFYEPVVLEKKTKRTKIITTIGPSTSTKEDIKKLYEKGMNVVRLNFSHGTQEEQLDKIQKVIQLRTEMNKPISIMLDTKGPEIRIGKMKNGKQIVKANTEVRVYCSNEEYLNRECNEDEMTVSYDMSQDLKPGNTVLVDDGKLNLTVMTVEKELVICKAFNTHELKTNKRVNLPGVNFSLPFMSEKDRQDIIFSTKNSIDYVAASFVNTGDNVREIRKILDDNDGKHIQIISKIESKIGLENIDEIIVESDGIMIARGDLGLEIPYYEVPYWEKQMIRKCREAGKVVIVATQMLESMTDSPAPTRAEVTDVYWATELGADATMLSGESAAGMFPFLATQTMATINKRAELTFYGKVYYDKAFEKAVSSTEGERADIASSLALKTKTGKYEFAIVYTRTGKLLKTISKFRPNVQILGVCEDEKLWTAFGVWHSIFMNKIPSINNETKTEIKLISDIVKQYGGKSGEHILVVDKHFIREFIIE